jgi:two-component system, NarL family, nitrate/nitrite response regulator NarL
MSTQNKIRLGLADDHQIVIDGLLSVMKNHPFLQVVVTANSGTEMLQLLKENKIDVLLTDVMMPSMNGQQLAKAVKQLYPTTKIIALSMSGEATTVEAMINDADISGYLLKQTNIVELANAIEKVYAGGVYFHEIILTELAQQHTLRKQTAEAKLTQRETQIIQLMETDLSNKEIAAHLNISVRTVETHRKNILAKTGCNNLLSLVKWAYEHGIISKK